MYSKLNFFQSDKIYEFWNSIPKHKAIKSQYYENGVEKGRLYGCLYTGPSLKSYFSRRCIVWGGPVIDSAIIEKEIVFEKLLNDFISQIRHRAIYLEFRNLFDCAKSNFKL